MNEEKCCLRCKGFILKIMFNGYHGICTKHGGLCDFVRFEEVCEDFEAGQNEIYEE